MIGTQLEEAGWRQGSIVNNADHERLFDIMGRAIESEVVFLMASQSCDIANNNIDSDPYVELSLARKIDTPLGHLTNNKNPRILHTHISCRTNDDGVLSEENIELKAFEKISIQKDVLVDLHPDLDRILEDRELKSYVAWLSARYSRPALPTAFNDRVSAADPKGKLRDKAKKGNEQLVGIYVELMPDTEIADDESYNVNLLGLLSAGFDGDTGKAENAIDAYAEVLRSAGMAVNSGISKEDEISIARIKRFKRIYFDDLSLREEAPLPPETINIL